MIGGVGRAQVREFYLRDFIPSINADDMALEPISRMVGTDRIVDKYLLCLKLDKEIRCL